MGAIVLRCELGHSMAELKAPSIAAVAVGAKAAPSPPAKMNGRQKAAILRV